MVGRPRKEEAPSGVSEMEKQRLANIAMVNQRMKAAGLSSLPQAPPKTSTAAAPKPRTRKPASKPVKKERILPTRTSSRLKGIEADSEVAKRKAEEERQVVEDTARAKRQRVSDDLQFGDILVSGKKPRNGDILWGVDVINKGVAMPNERTFGDEQIKNTSDKKLKALRQSLANLELWDAWLPNEIKIVPERIYSMTMHPSAEAPLVFAGDKLGNLGFINASQKRPGSKVKEEDDEIKKEEEEQKPSIRSPKRRNINLNPGDTDPDDSDEEDSDLEDAVPKISTLKPHARTISGMHFHPSSAETLYTSSYDSSIRATNFIKSLSTEVHAPNDHSMDEPVSALDMAPHSPHVVYFTTLNGALGHRDLRSPQTPSTVYQLSEKKIGGFSLNPSAPHYAATASLDRTMCLWDLRSVKKHLPLLVGEHESRLSVSHASFNASGQVATASYDDSIKIHNFSSASSTPMSSWPPGKTLSAEEAAPTTVVRHNCQTGRWVTILKPQWQRNPEDGVEKLCIGNMNRFVDLFDGEGEQLAQLGGEGISAVPAVAVWHPSRNWVAAGTASGKLCLWM
ncbi:MAG: hypothetical protein Q9227_006817 [Pyrenula ochraceoflavens]